MRLGAALAERSSEPEQWIASLRQHGYTTALWPLGGSADEDLILAYCDAAARANITIAEVGVWNNPLAGDAAQRQAAIQRCQERLALADAVGARCCVNIAGSRGEQWDGPDPQNFSAETFDMIVDTVREIVDAVRPARSFYTLEPMPWVYPDSADSYLDLLRAIDRPRFAVHVDPVNVITSPRAFFTNSLLIREWFRKLGPYIKSCHAKDIRLGGKLTVHLDEVRPGLGALDYRTYLQELDRLDRETPLIIEHLSSAGDYLHATDYIRAVAQEVGVAFV